MYSVLSELLSDRKGGEVFSCFGGWHLGYLVLFLLIALFPFFLLRRRSDGCRQRCARAFGDIAFGLYIADFFLMPFAYGEIDIEKLPFHACTATCVACFLSGRIRFLEKYRLHLALLGLVSNFVYLIYPAGVMWYAVHPLSYRVVQTLSFHGCMSVYGFLTIAFDKEFPRLRACYRDLLVLCAMTLWAILGNTLYNGAENGEMRAMNWFFTCRDPFYILPERIAPFVMPFLNIAVFFAVELLLYALFYVLRARKRGMHQ